MGLMVEEKLKTEMNGWEEHKQAAWKIRGVAIGVAQVLNLS